MAIDLSSRTQVGPALLAYLASHLGVSPLRFEEPPEQITHGWETYIYSFRLVGAGLDPRWAKPLILRAYPGNDQGEKAEQEAAVQRYAAERGYPAPRPLAVETNVPALGRPFIVMERAPGDTMLDRMTRNPVKVVRYAALMADTQIALHRLPVDGCPLPSDGPLVDRQIAAMSEELEKKEIHLTNEAAEAFDWLKAMKSVVMREDISLCHHDFHPLNIMVDDEDRVAVLDWPAAALGDRHSDLASTLVLLRTAPIDPPTLIERLTVRFGRRLFLWLYFRRYHRQLPVDTDRLRYWEAFQAFYWWMGLLALETVDPATVGMKPDTAERIPEGHLRRVRSYFWQRVRG